MPQYYVYIMASRSLTLYVEVTNNLERRVYEHKHGFIEGFTSKYKVNRLVYFESTENVTSAIEREKQLKGWKRNRKIDLVSSMNPKWRDLSTEFYAPGDPSLRSG